MILIKKSCSIILWNKNEFHGYYAEIEETISESYHEVIQNYLSLFNIGKVKVLFDVWTHKK